MPRTTMKSSKSTSRRSMPRRGAKSGTMESQTKEELYRKAKKAGIEGRSQMSKSELISALRHR
ncbi:Rho termination factor N-terminal domain-containing protein [Streptomyces coffeae]|uniref:Rho termination factor N-terminal domain-containing protein n=1 Tax=Streptomyces coffeae TaxID=621382 RepID=A0ABS1N9L5_9ACTN|nr:Rho termination factor N-terminal domain-containing protein [Streptomyces coffeae]MBL1096639.1 Rho termination factor N-terminal domain-containing protein [Streptomyces coffeae]